MFNTIQQIAKENPYGFTYNIKTNSFVKYGFVVAYSETQDSFGVEGLKKALTHALANNGIIGGWLNTENNRYYFDSCRVFRKREEALRFGTEQKQLAIFDLSTFTEIKL